MIYVKNADRKRQIYTTLKKAIKDGNYGIKIYYRQVSKFKIENYAIIILTQNRWIWEKWIKWLTFKCASGKFFLRQKFDYIYINCKWHALLIILAYLTYQEMFFLFKFVKFSFKKYIFD